MAFGTRNMLD